MLTPLILPSLVAIVAAGMSIGHYAHDDVMRAIYWLLVAVIGGRWFSSNLDTLISRDK